MRTRVEGLPPDLLLPPEGGILPGYIKFVRFETEEVVINGQPGQRETAIFKYCSPPAVEPGTTRCRHCSVRIQQLASGTWINSFGLVFCVPQPTRVGDLHEPFIEGRLLERICELARANPDFWTPREIARLMQLTIPQVKEVLGD
jgi:hypothetical protein